jgi:hypothetical protein
MTWRDGLDRWRHRLTHWGWIRHHDDGHPIGFIAGGLVASIDAVLPPKYYSGYPVAEGATFAITFRTDGPVALKHAQAGGLRLRIPPVASWRTPSVFLGLLFRGPWNSPMTRLTREGRAARRRVRERRRQPERVLGYEQSRWRDGYHVSETH